MSQRGMTFRKGTMARSLTLSIMILARAAAAIPLDLDDPSSIRDAAATIAWGMMTWYSGNETEATPGLLPYPAKNSYTEGAVWTSLVDYWYYTGDTT